MVASHIPMRVSAALAAALLFTLPVQAQDDRNVERRLDQIERDLQDLSRQVYTGDDSDFVSGRQGGFAAGPAPVGGDAAARLQARVDAIEQSLRTLTGQVEQMSFELRQTRERLDLMDREAQFRATGQLPGLPQTAASGAAAPTPLMPADPAIAAPPVTALQPGQGTLGSIPQNDLQSGLSQLPAEGAAPAVSAPAQVASAAPIAPSAAGNPKDQFDAAMRLLTSAQYDAARQSFATFVAQHPKDPMAGQAQYWIGETHFIQKDYTTAARAYAESLKTYPESGRGADAMLKLGLSLINLGQKQEGCATLAAISSKYPKASEAVTGRATRERRQAACG